MGDLVRDAFQASGINDEMEQVIADVILQRWTDLQGLDSDTAAEKSDVQAGPTQPTPAPQELAPETRGLDYAKVRVLAEQLWRRLERRYEQKLEAWKKGEEKQLGGMLEKLRNEYKQNVEAKNTHYSEIIRHKEEEMRRLEERLKEENRLEFEKQHMQTQCEWHEIETERRSMRLARDQFETAKANFAIRVENEEMRLRRDRSELERWSDEVKERSRKLDELINNAVNETERRERNWIAEKVNEWNAREAKLAEKCEQLCERVRQSTIEQNTIREQDSTIKLLQAQLEACRQKLVHTEGKLKEMETRVCHAHDYDQLKEENVKLKFELESGVMAERLKAKELEVMNMERRLKLVEEASTLRVRELKLQLKLLAEKLERKCAECRKYRSALSTNANANVLTVETPKRPVLHNKCRPQSVSESQSSATSSSSSFDRHLRSRLRNLDQLSHQLDVSLEKYRRSGWRANSDLELPRQSLGVLAQPSHQRTISDEYLGKDSGEKAEGREQSPATKRPQTFVTRSSGFLAPLMTSTPTSSSVLSGAQQRAILAKSIEQLTPLKETSAERVHQLEPIVLPPDRVPLPETTNPSVETTNHEVTISPPKSASDKFEEVLRKRTSSTLRDNLVETTGEQAEEKAKGEASEPEIDPLMEHYMKIIMQKRKIGNGNEAFEQEQQDTHSTVLSKVDSPGSGNGSVAAAQVALDPIEEPQNSGSDFDW